MTARALGRETPEMHGEICDDAKLEDRLWSAIDRGGAGRDPLSEMEVREYRGV